MKTYDCIVIGAGNGGLASATTMARAGKKTLLIEKHNIPGGVATSFVRGRFEFEGSLHELCEYGADGHFGPSKNIFDDLGIEIKFSKIPDLYRLKGTYSDGSPMDVLIPSGEEDFVNKMVEYVPECKEALLEFISIANEIEDAAWYTNNNGTKDVLYILKTFPRFIKYSSYTVNEMFDILEMPTKARDIMNGYWSYLGVDYDNLIFMHYVVMVHNYIKYYPVIPKYTSSELEFSMENSFRLAGGTIIYNTMATEILFNSDKSVRGVKTNNGEFYAKHIICNANPTTAYNKLIPKEYIPKNLLKLANKRTFGARGFIVYMGLDIDYRKLGITDYTVIFSEEADSVKECEKIKSFETNNFFIANCYNVINENASPKGTCILSLTTMYSSDCWNNIDINDYDNMKNKLANHFIDLYEARMSINIRNHIEEIAISTPWTYHRYAFTPSGCAYGYELKKWDNILGRVQSEKNAYPIKGLKFCGGNGAIGNGYNVSIQNGVNIAKLTLKDMEVSK